MKRKRVTIKDVAAYADVSRQTVSRVINKKGNVADETRQRVQQAITELDYHPNPAARGLVHSRTNSIGLVAPYTSDVFFSDPHLLRFMCGVDHVAGQRNVSLVLSTGQLCDENETTQPDELTAYKRLTRAGYVDGAIVIETIATQEGIALLEQLGYPWVTLGYSETTTNGTRVVHADDYGGARQAMMHLLSLGHRRIGIINGTDQAPTAFRKRLIGCRQAMADHGLTLDAELIIEGNLTPESGYQAMIRLMAIQPHPTAIFALNDRMATGVLRYLTEHAIPTPQHISVVGFDDIPTAEIASLTTVRQPALEMGHQAARLLFDLMEERTLPNQPIVLPTELIVRGSTGPVAEK